MKWTFCYFVRDLETRRIVHHEIHEVEMSRESVDQRATESNRRRAELQEQYPLPAYDVFMQGFSSLEALYGAFPEIAPGGGG